MGAKERRDEYLAKAKEAEDKPPIVRTDTSRKVGYGLPIAIETWPNA